jgi:hypothetical protein
MKYRSLFEIANSILLQKGYPVHYLAMYLKYGADCLRELTFDTLKIVNKVSFEGATEYDLPCDFVDAVRVGYYQTPCEEWSASVEDCDCYGNCCSGGMYWRYGYYFGMWSTTHRIEDGKLKVSSKGKLLFEYISDSSNADSASLITPYAQKTIEDYSEWKYKDKRRSYGPREVLLAKQEFNAAHDRLRSRLSPLTMEMIKGIILRGDYAM